ncbi:MAG: hypothetical protein CM15mP107_2950 [Bacteroidota bacterium]|nr:MAG: hypothetical protein CM15mP107_2950 [Bacteroidota bacterium]
METKELLKKVRKIEIKTRRLSNHIFSGEYHSHFKGRGMTFSEVRKYQFGDDIRDIDWNVTAKLNEPHIKIFEEERELTMMLLVDVSKSEFFGTRIQQKRDLITELCAVLSFSAIQNNDKVGVVFFTDQIELFIPPKKGKSHILRIIRELIEFKPKGTGTNISEALKFLSSVIKKRSIVFTLSDFQDEAFDKNLKIASSKHDLTAIRIIDPAEEKLPDIGLVQLQNPETGTIGWVDTSSSIVRANYEKDYQNFVANFKSYCTHSGTDYLDLRVDLSYTKQLLEFFKRR